MVNAKTAAPRRFAPGHSRPRGKFDGTLGVIAALEAVRTLKEQKMVLQSPVEVVCFVGEESSRFGYSTLGSSLMAGEVRGKDLAHAADAQGTKLEDILASMGIYRNNLLSMRRDPSTIKAYLELHIEQGPILEARKNPLALLPPSLPRRDLRVVFTGQADHSGTTPMEMRRDALVAASGSSSPWKKFAADTRRVQQGRVVGTVGAMKIEPGVINAIPGRAELSVDIRSISAEAKKRVVGLVQAQIREIASRNIGAEILPLREEEPVPLDQRLVRLLKECCEDRNIPYEVMPSGAVMTRCRWPRLPPPGCYLFPAGGASVIARWNGRNQRTSAWVRNCFWIP